MNLHIISQKLKNTSSSPFLDAEILLSNTIKKPKEYLYSNTDIRLNSQQLKKLISLVKRRIKYEPISYIIGHKEFFGLDFIVNKKVLIPRPQTESLVEKTLEIVDNSLTKKFHIIDIGTGSGCIIIALATYLKKYPYIQFYATDISTKALDVAKQNAKKHSLHKKIRFLKGNLLSPLFNKSNNTAFISRQNKPINNCRYQRPDTIIIANLPYITPERYKNLKKDIKNYEPKSSLVAKDNGLFFYKKLLKQIEKNKTLINPFHLLVELESYQKKILKQYIQKHFTHYTVRLEKNFPGLIILSQKSCQ